MAMIPPHPDREPVCGRHISGYKVNGGLLQPQQEVSVAAEPVEFGDDELCTAETAGLECLGQRRAVRCLPLPTSMNSATSR